MSGLVLAVVLGASGWCLVLVLMLLLLCRQGADEKVQYCMIMANNTIVEQPTNYDNLTQVSSTVMQCHMLSYMLYV